MTLFKGISKNVWDLLRKRTFILAFLFYWLIFIIGAGAALGTPESGPELVAKLQQRAFEA
jgi:preprotein translocase subunit SecG